MNSLEAETSSHRGFVNLYLWAEFLAVDDAMPVSEAVVSPTSFARRIIGLCNSDLNELLDSGAILPMACEMGSLRATLAPDEGVGV